MSATKSPVVLLTGASRGLGLATATALLERNARVFAVSRTPLSALPEHLQRASPTTFRYLELDLSNPGAAARAVQETLSHFGGINAVIHNAGALQPLARIADADMSEWRKLFEVNFFCGVELIQAALPHLRKLGDAQSGADMGRIVIVSSGAAVKASVGWGPYCTSKATVNMLVSGLGLEEKNVISVAVRPGVVDTEMQTYIREKGQSVMDPEGYERFTRMKEHGMILPPELPGTAIAQLALAATKEMSGQFVNWDDKRIKEPK
ncbi:hypothetical protein HK104_008952 [Borealophlyctis nickersoniae]|nr:hypothetical protein HK104_008952 [Borealophlyctis nickersoniae]